MALGLSFVAFATASVGSWWYRERMATAIKRRRSELRQPEPPASWFFGPLVIEQDYRQLIPQGQDGHKFRRMIKLGYAAFGGLIVFSLLSQLLAAA